MRSSVHVFYPKITKTWLFVLYCAHLFVPLSLDHRHDVQVWSNFTKFFAQNFQLFGLKKLISTSYAPESKKYKMPYQPTLFETSQPHFNADKTKTNGKKDVAVIESVLKGYPLGLIYFNNNVETGKYEVLDGQQRITSLGRFVKNKFAVKVNGLEQIFDGLNVRLFDKPTMRKVYQQQTDKAKAEGISNCPYCAIGHDQNAHRIWKLEEMDADHVTAWSKGGETTIDNCQMLCKTHNRSKGNR